MIIVIKLISEQNMTRRTVLCVCHVIIVIIIISIKRISISECFWQRKKRQNDSGFSYLSCHV